MLTPVRSLSPAMRLAELRELLRHSAQMDFPILEGGHVVGLLAKDAILSALCKKEPGVPISEIMDRRVVSARETTPLDPLYQHMRRHQLSLVPILRRGELVGLLTLEQIGKYHLLCGTREWTEEAAELEESPPGEGARA